MPNKKISELNELTIPDTADLLAIVDVSASETMRITLANLLAGVLTNPLTTDLDMDNNNITNAGTINSGAFYNAVGEQALAVWDADHWNIPNAISFAGGIVITDDTNYTSIAPYSRYLMDTSGTIIMVDWSTSANGVVFGTKIDVTGKISCDTEITIGDTTMTEQNLIDLLALL
jgi:hypothetical protein